MVLRFGTLPIASKFLPITNCVKSNELIPKAGTINAYKTIDHQLCQLLFSGTSLVIMERLATEISAIEKTTSIAIPTIKLM